MDEDNDISVIIPLYNKENTIIRALNSVFLQTKQPFEIIIIDDGSTDNGLSLIKNITDRKVKIITQANQGVSAARNKGIEISTCPYIAFLDADDEWFPDFLFMINNLINNFPDAIGYGTAYFLKYESGFIKNIILQSIRFQGSYGLLSNYFEVAANSDPPIWTSSVCITKKGLQLVNGFPIGIKSGEDLLTWARLTLIGTFAYSVVPQAIYNQPTYSNTFSIPEKIDFVGHEFAKIYKLIPPREKKYFRKYLGNWHKMRASLCLISGRNLWTLKEVSLSIYYNFKNLKVFLIPFLIVLPRKIQYYLLFTRNKLDSIN
jgi:glycosyltransferase involved in cell wall biosynthesis